MEIRKKGEDMKRIQLDLKNRQYKCIIKFYAITIVPFKIISYMRIGTLGELIMEITDVKDTECRSASYMTQPLLSAIQ